MSTEVDTSYRTLIPPEQERAADRELIREWTTFLHTMNQGYQRVADQRGEVYLPLDETEVRDAARIAADFKVRPYDAVGGLPAWCDIRPRLQVCQR